MIDLGLKVTRGDATMLYATSMGSYTVRIHLCLDHMIDAEKLRYALDLTAKRYPYLCVTLKKNEQEYYYEPNNNPIALIHSGREVSLNAPETNGHIWAVCYDGDNLFVDFFHGRTDGSGIYSLIATLLYYYFDEQDGSIQGIRTLETPVSKKETHDPVEDLPIIDLSQLSFPPMPKALNLMQTSGFSHVDGKGLITRLMIPEDAFLPFARATDGTPGILISVLLARAIERVHPQHQDPLVNNYVVNARPMLKADETFHNCTNRVIFHYDEKVRSMPLQKQCTVYRGKTFVQADEETIIQAMTVAGSMAQMILDLPDFASKAQTAAQATGGMYDAATYMVSYVGRWKHTEIGKHIRGFWTETPVGPFPLIEIAAVNGQICVSVLQPFSERIYYDALLAELKENDIPYTECGTAAVRVAGISFD